MGFGRYLPILDWGRGYNSTVLTNDLVAAAIVTIMLIPQSLAYDASALESREAINRRLADSGVTLHLSEVKGPVMDALEKSHLLHDLTGKVWLSQNAAFASLIKLADAGDGPPTPFDAYAARGLI